MRRVILLIFLLVALASAQQPAQTNLEPPLAASLGARVTERNYPVSKADLYCAGYVSPQVLPHDRFVEAGLGTPVQSRFRNRDFIYLRGGGYTPGTRVSIIREMRDPNRYTPFPTSRNLLAKVGQLYGELGYATVIENRGTDIAIAQIEFTCGEIAPGDLVVPFTVKEPLSFRKHSTLDLFPEGHGQISGRILAARDFDQFLISGRDIYLNVGEKSGLKPGDYLRIVRNYEPKSMDPTDVQVFRQPTGEDTQKSGAPAMSRKQLVDLPYHVIGEALVLSTQPGAATAVITFALEEIQLGDRVELE